MTPLQTPAPRGSASDDCTRSLRAMGLSFQNFIGIAAGIDRDGSMLSSLSGLVAGHVEIGTVTDPRTLKIPRSLPGKSQIIGINIGSAKVGFSEEVLADYRACLLSAVPYADYIVLNFSNESAQRILNSEAGHRIVSMARNEINFQASEKCGRTPLLAKMPAGAPGEDLPVTQSMAEELDGFVLVGDKIERIAEIRSALPGHGIVSVGGIRRADDVLQRRQAGSDLVQVHGAFANGGAAAFERILRDLEGRIEDV